ncbi:hypothetical protein [Nocardioides sp. B-3]|uniref:hypothetical protein n=1 Tax=Nocardioides sp. B-3 TaxID=2895565 RepID=UPI002152BBA0|nr:hypothetical protein [Nocardioides sp. B-3]UUZ58472.1 hypothetical protein LP418_20165 [Nocardioides sp. B-3]
MSASPVEVTDHEDALSRLAGDDVTLRRARHVFTEIERVSAAVDALVTGDPAEFGARLTGSHASLRDDFEVSCAELDVVVEACPAHGALGARMTGGGFGGSAIALLPEAVVDVTVASLQQEFAGRGWTEPRARRATPADGARLIQD